MYSLRGKRLSLPIGTDQDYYDYLTVAWHVYWKTVRRAARRRKCNLLEAHQYLQRKHPFPPPDTGGGFWQADDFLLLYLWRFEEWQMREYDLSKIRSQGDFFALDTATEQTPLAVAFEMVGDPRRDDFIQDLWCRGLWTLVEKMKDDPIFGYEARKELEGHAWDERYKSQERTRKDALPAKVKEIDTFLEKLGPSNYNVLFPYAKNQHHDIENCLCVLADGGPIFRLEVLDPEGCTRFRLMELMPPWWKETGGMEPCGPGEGEYDFPFYDFNIHEGGAFGFDKLMEVLKRGKGQINTRAERKWGKK